MQQPIPGKLYRIKPGKLLAWQAWCHKLNGRLRTSALRTLQQEGVLEEFFITFRIGRSWYTLGCIVTEGGKPPKLVRSSAPVNMQHRKKIHECLIPVGRAEFSYFLKRS